MLFKPQSYQPSASESQLKTKRRTLKLNRFTRVCVFTASGTVAPRHRVNGKGLRDTAECSWFQSLESIQAGSWMKRFLFNSSVRSACFRKEALFWKVYTNDTNVEENNVMNDVSAFSDKHTILIQRAPGSVPVRWTFTYFNVEPRYFCSYQIYMCVYIYTYISWLLARDLWLENSTEVRLTKLGDQHWAKNLKTHRGHSQQHFDRNKDV